MGTKVRRLGERLQSARGMIAAERKELERLVVKGQHESMHCMEELGKQLLTLRSSLKEADAKWNAERAPLLTVLEKVSGRHGDVLAKLARELGDERREGTITTERRAHERGALETGIQKGQNEFEEKRVALVKQAKEAQEEAVAAREEWAKQREALEQRQLEEQTEHDLKLQVLRDQLEERKAWARAQLDPLEREKERVLAQVQAAKDTLRAAQDGAGEEAAMQVEIRAIRQQVAVAKGTLKAETDMLREEHVQQQQQQHVQQQQQQQQHVQQQQQQHVQQQQQLQQPLPPDLPPVAITTGSSFGGGSVVSSGSFATAGLQQQYAWQSSSTPPQPVHLPSQAINGEPASAGTSDGASAPRPGTKPRVSREALAAFFGVYDREFVEKVDLVLKTIGSGKKLLKMLQAKYGAVPAASYS
jgi:hypothetical protein